MTLAARNPALDSATRELRELIAVQGKIQGAAFDVTQDNRSIVWARTAAEGGVWLGEMEPSKTKKP